MRPGPTKLIGSSQDDLLKRPLHPYPVPPTGSRLYRRLATGPRPR